MGVRGRVRGLGVGVRVRGRVRTWWGALKPHGAAPPPISFSRWPGVRLVLGLGQVRLGFGSGFGSSSFGSRVGLGLGFALRACRASPCPPNPTPSSYPQSLSLRWPCARRAALVRDGGRVGDPLAALEPLGFGLGLA